MSAAAQEIPIMNKSLKRLIDGNHRFVNSTCKSLVDYHVNRLSTVEAQKPFALILACSDSRVSPEIIFDQGIGDLFVIRVAGNILEEVQWETIKFGVEILDIDTILVLGHESCGAVQATIEKADLEIPLIREQISKGISNLTNINYAAKTNVRYVVGKLKERLKDKNAEVFGGFYHISSGEVEILSETPVPLHALRRPPPNPQCYSPPLKLK
jgi:carbonic anhydrase